MSPMDTPPFELTDRRIDVRAGTLTFSFRLGDDEFTETFALADPAILTGNPDHPAIAHLLDVAHLCIGVSYYKLTLPGRIVSAKSLHPMIVALAEHLYDQGLRELAVRNGLEVPLPVRVDCPTSDDSKITPLTFDTNVGPLLPFGGGKDSTLTLSLVDDPVALTIHPTAVQRRSAAAARVPLIEVERQLDPLLFERTTQGGFNGHVPITAINSSVSALIAALIGRRDVIIANERSAEEPTQRINGVEVNHQYSKTFRFESALADALAPSGMRYFSAVRRYSELAIAGALACNETLRNAILSCNRVFSLTNPPANPQWCRNCAKCRFTFVSFAVFLTPNEAREMFGGDLLADSDQIDGVRDLWRNKPFDCVGELAESAIALATLAASKHWRDHVVVAALGDEAREVATASGTTLAALFEPSGQDLVPPEYRARIVEAMSIGGP